MHPFTPPSREGRPAAGPVLRGAATIPRLTHQRDFGFREVGITRRYERTEEH